MIAAVARSRASRTLGARHGGGRRPKPAAWASPPRLLVVVVVRTHMNHGGGGGADLLRPAAVTPGPRPSLQLGLDAARAAPNILRLLEASHGENRGAHDTLATVWHGEGRVWYQQESQRESGGIWKAAPFEDPAVLQDQQAATSSFGVTPSLQSLHFADERTALVKLQTASSTTSYLSLLRLEPDASSSSMPMSGGRPAHDGWQIVREVVASSPITSPSVDAIPALVQTLRRYLAVEHGGGPDARAEAARLFMDDDAVSLLSAGTAPPEDPATAWTAPAGHFLRIPLATYLDGVAAQTPRDQSSQHDCIVSIDVAGDAAAAVVRVGNGAQTTVFGDHLLLGRTSDSNCEWKILSKTFAPRPWPHSH